MADDNCITEEKINLIYFSGTGSVWNVSDWRRILQHRISGRFVGNLPQQCHQVNEMGFPLMLSRNETTLLLETNAAVLNNPKHLIRLPNDDMKLKYKAFREHSLSQQVELLKEQRRREIRSKADVIITGKLSKRQRMSSSVELTEDEKETIIQEQLMKISEPSESNLLLQISTEDCFDEPQWEPVMWTYPETEQEKLEYATYRALHAMGYWITAGAKFGGQFLVYPGSPLQCHAQYIIRCVADNLSPLNFIAFGRIAHSTRKVPVFAYKTKPDGKISFQSVSWVSD